MNNPTMIYAQSFELVRTKDIVYLNFIQTVPRLSTKGRGKTSVGTSVPTIAASIVLPVDAAIELQAVLNNSFKEISDDVI